MDTQLCKHIKTITSIHQNNYKILKSDYYNSDHLKLPNIFQILLDLEYHLHQSQVSHKQKSCKLIFPVGSKVHLPSPGRQPQFVCTYARHLGQVQGTGQMSLRTFASQSNLCCYSCRYLKESNVSRHFFLSTFVPETLEFINRKDEYKSRWIRVVESMICHLTDSGFFTYKLRLWQY